MSVAQSTLTTRALATCGVYGPAGDDERAVLSLADDFRREYCALMQERHDRTINLRNDLFPALFAAMVEYERLYFVIADLEKEIKAHHSEVRDRNSVTAEQEESLVVARDARAALLAKIKEERKPWLAMLKEFRAELKTAADWKNVKSLDKRQVAYAAITWPDELRPLAEIMLDTDLRMRELGLRYQAAGLHSAIRGEIVEASQQKLGKDKPGIRYRYGRTPEPRQWIKLVIQFAGGLTVADALDGRHSGFSITPDYAIGDAIVCWVRQQIGTANHPRMIEYRAKIHRDLPHDARLQRWTLAIREGRRVCIPLVAGLDTAKPTGEGVLRYDLSWTVRKAGVQVCHFVSDRINERLILPSWLVEDRMAMKDEQQATDVLANEALAKRGRLPPPGKQQGVCALEKYCNEHTDDYAAGNILADLQSRLRRADKRAKKALGCIEKIYETVASRVCKLHESIVLDPIDLVRIKKYDKRDLLREDVLPARSREIMFAVAPGKLQALLKRYGLPVASGEVAQAAPHGETDVFTGYIAGIGVKTGTKVNAPTRRSQMSAAVQLQ